MWTIVFRSCLALSLLLVAGGGSVGWAAGAQTPWNSADVVALTEQLSAALDDLLVDSGLRAEQPTAFQERKHEAAISTLKQLRPGVADLRRHVAGDSDPDGSRPYFEQLDELREEIASYAEESWLPDATRAKAKRVRTLFDRLARYYQ
jgi:hypothetical protein